VRSGFVTLVGRPNVGKSTLLNAMLGTKVSIVSNKPQTTRTQVCGVLHVDPTEAVPEGAQVVFVDTPGFHKPVTALGERLNTAAADALDDVDVACLVIDASAPVGGGDRWVADRLPRRGDLVVVVNKIDAVPRGDVIRQLERSSALGLGDAAEYFPVSARTGEGVPALVDHLVGRLPEGPPYYPDDMVTDVPEAFWVAELVREQLLAVLREELPYSVATRVVEWEWPLIRCEILVERDSQKGMVIGKGGAVLKAVGVAVREQLPEGTYLQLVVKVDPEWQRRPRALERLGY
jgi:GTP-binding protein Era